MKGIPSFRYSGDFAICRECVDTGDTPALAHARRAFALITDESDHRPLKNLIYVLVGRRG